MSYDQVSACFKAIMEIPNDSLASLVVKINHDISAENNIDFKIETKPLNQIQPLKLNHISDIIFDFELTGELDVPVNCRDCS